MRVGADESRRALPGAPALSPRSAFAASPASVRDMLSSPRVTPSSLICRRVQLVREEGTRRVQSVREEGTRRVQLVREGGAGGGGVASLSSTRALDAARLPLGVGGGGGVGRRGGGAAAGRGAPANHEEARCGGGKGSSG